MTLLFKNNINVRLALSRGLLGDSLGIPCPEALFLEEMCKKPASNPLASQYKTIFSISINAEKKQSSC